MSTYAFITGAYRGLGFETAKMLLQEGYSVFVAARSFVKAEAAAAALKASGQSVYPLELDVERGESIERAVSAVLKHTPALHLLINNAAVMRGEEAEKSLETVPAELLRETFLANVLGPLEVIKAFLPLLEKAGGARIVNVSSSGGSLEQMTGMLFAPAYQISKTALNAVTRQLSSSLKAKHISVNSVCPGWCRTAMGGESAPRSAEEGARSIVWAALQPDQNLTGGFFLDGKPVPW